jgi:heme/copper-type cytochrome/quinol oxidase subunit 2
MLPFMRKSLARSTLLGVLALGTLLWGGVHQLGINPNTLVAQLLLLLAALLVTMLLAACVALLVSAARARRRRRDRDA